jgi:hypothetical protein
MNDRMLVNFGHGGAFLVGDYIPELAAHPIWMCTQNRIFTMLLDMRQH